MENWERGGFGIYVHWPFCAAICPYCDFNVHLSRGPDIARWRRAFASEIATQAERFPGRRPGSVYFGGGTPSLMPPALVADILGMVRSAWPGSVLREVTLEVNPESSDLEHLRELVAAGITRFSVGVQSLRPDGLRALGRRHGVAEGRTAIERVISLDVPVTFDLIYGRPDQSVEAWTEELREALTYPCGHLSLYQLTIEPGTPFARQIEKGRLTGLPDEGLSAAFYDATTQIMREDGRAPYEVSNYARPGAEAVHNGLYWDAGDWLGVGPGAFGRLTDGDVRLSTMATRAPEAWLTECERDGTAIEVQETLDAEDQAEERLSSGMRRTRGVSRDILRDLGFDVDDRVVDDLVGEGFLDRSPTHLRATQSGRLLLDALVGRLVPLQPVGQ